MSKNIFRNAITIITVSSIFTMMFLPTPSVLAATTHGYDWQLVKQSSYLTLRPGEVGEAWIDIKNTGTKTWNTSDSVVHLGTGSKLSSNGQSWDHPSEFYFGQDECMGGEECFGLVAGWISSNRPMISQAGLSLSEVRTGETTRWTFYLKAPDNPGVYRAYFTPVVEGITWMNDIGLYWEINVARGHPYSFDYENLNNPINAEVNRNTSTIASADQKLLFNALRNNIDYQSFSGSMEMNLAFKFNATFLEQFQEPINSYDLQFAELGIPLNFSEKISERLNIGIRNDSIVVGDVGSSKTHLKNSLSVSSEDFYGGKTDILDVDIEAIENNGFEQYLKINKVGLLDGYFDYANSGNWYKQEAMAGLGGFSKDRRNYDMYKNDAEKALLEYQNALARDLFRAGINIENMGAEYIEGEACERLKIDINSDNATKYFDILNEKSSLDQERFLMMGNIIKTYLGDSSLGICINPNTGVAKEITFTLNINANEIFDEFSFVSTYTMHSYNNSNLSVDIPSNALGMDELDLGQRLQEKMSPTYASMLRLSSKVNTWKTKISDAVKKTREYLRK